MEWGCGYLGSIPYISRKFRQAQIFAKWSHFEIHLPKSEKSKEYFRSGNCPGGELSVGELSGWGVVRVGNCPVGELSGYHIQGIHHIIPGTVRAYRVYPYI